MHQTLSKEMRNCIKACLDASTTCTDTVVHCLGEGGKQAQARHIQLLLDCADICETGANFISRHSDRHAEVCALCAEVCMDVAESCRSMGEDETMLECAEVCERCADQCEKMSGNMKELPQTERSDEKQVGQVI